MTENARKALLSLLLLLPVPSLSLVAAMIAFPDTALGQGIFVAGKLWLLLLPLIWVVAVERSPLPRPQFTTRGLAAGAATGLVIAAVIYLAWLAIGRTAIEPAAIAAILERVGLHDPTRYLVMAVYWSFVNALLEEYVWRWFVVRQCRALLPPAGAIIVSALGFTAHHVIAMQLYFPGPIVALASAGIFLGGAIWSWLYLRYRSIWPAYLSHLCADLAIFAIGYAIVFNT